MEQKQEISKRVLGILYTLIAIQLLSWAWFSNQGGDLSDKAFLIFTGCMLGGQVAAGVETFLRKSWGAFAASLWFFSFTVWGGVVRFLSM